MLVGPQETTPTNPLQDHPAAFTTLHAVNETRQRKATTLEDNSFFSQERKSCLKQDLNWQRSVYALPTEPLRSSAGQAKSLKFMKGKGCLFPDGQGNSMQSRPCACTCKIPMKQLHLKTAIFSKGNNELPQAGFEYRADALPTEPPRQLS